MALPFFGRGALTGLAAVTVTGDLTMAPGTKVILDNSTSATSCPLQFNTDPNSGLRWQSADVWWSVTGGNSAMAYQVGNVTANEAVFTIGGAATVASTLTTAGARVMTPSATQSLTAVGDAITAGALDEFAAFSATGILALTSAPTIANGDDGQVITLVNVGSNAVTISDQGTLANSNLRLAAVTIAIGARQSVKMMYSATIGDWIQVGPLVAVI